MRQWEHHGSIVVSVSGWESFVGPFVITAYLYLCLAKNVCTFLKRLCLCDSHLFAEVMSNQFWAGACLESLNDEARGRTRSMLYGAHGFTIACFVLGSIFTGFWLNRWRCVKRSPNRELLLSTWRFTGVFLALSFMSCIFGVAAWISKLTLVYSNTERQFLTSSGANVSCQRDFSLSIQGNRSQSSYRISYSIEFACLFLSILLSLDRISEQALNAKTLTKARSLSASFQQQPVVHAAAQRLTSIGSKLVDNSRDQTSSGPRSSSEFGKSRILPLVFKAGLAFVALCCLTSIVSVITAASFQAKMVSDYQRAYDACDSDGNVTQASTDIYAATLALNDPPLMKSIFAGHLCEFCAAISVILLYVAVGYIGFAIVSAARKKIDASRAKLQQLQTTIGSQHEAKAAAAGAARKAVLIASHTRLLVL